MNEKELADLRKTEADTAGVYIEAGVIDPMDERQRLTADPESPYMRLSLGQGQDPGAPSGEEDADLSDLLDEGEEDARAVAGGGSRRPVDRRAPEGLNQEVQAAIIQNQKQRHA